MKRLTFPVLIMLFCVMIPSLVRSQSPSLHGEIRGKVLDSKTKTPLDYASIVIQNSRHKVIAQVLSDDDGSYIVKQMDPGEYTIKVTNLGYLNVVVEHQKVEAGQIVFVNIPMTGDKEKMRIICVTRCCLGSGISLAKVEDKSSWIKEQREYQVEKNLMFNCTMQHKSRVIEQELKESAVKLFNEIKSFPTTTHSVINIESMYDGEKEIVIRNLSGLEVYHGTIVHHLQLQVSDFPVGLYVVTIVDRKYDEKSFTKFIVAQ
jgi:hypothetical protein